MQMFSTVNDQQCSTGELPHWSPIYIEQNIGFESSKSHVPAFSEQAWESNSARQAVLKSEQEIVHNSDGQGGGGYGESSGADLAHSMPTSRGKTSTEQGKNMF